MATLKQLKVDIEEALRHANRAKEYIDKETTFIGYKPTGSHKNSETFTNSKGELIEPVTKFVGSDLFGLILAIEQLERTLSK